MEEFAAAAAAAAAAQQPQPPPVPPPHAHPHAHPHTHHTCTLHAGLHCHGPPPPFTYSVDPGLHFQPMAPPPPPPTPGPPAYPVLYHHQPPPPGPHRSYPPQRASRARKKLRSSLSGAADSPVGSPMPTPTHDVLPTPVVQPALPVVAPAPVPVVDSATATSAPRWTRRSLTDAVEARLARTQSFGMGLAGPLIDMLATYTTLDPAVGDLVKDLYVWRTDMLQVCVGAGLKNASGKRVGAALRAMVNVLWPENEGGRLAMLSRLPRKWIGFELNSEGKALLRELRRGGKRPVAGDDNDDDWKKVHTGPEPPFASQAFLLPPVWCPERKEWEYPVPCDILCSAEQYVVRIMIPSAQSSDLFLEEQLEDGDDGADDDSSSKHIRIEGNFRVVPELPEGVAQHTDGGQGGQEVYRIQRRLHAPVEFPLRMQIELPRDVDPAAIGQVTKSPSVIAIAYRRAQAGAGAGRRI